LECRLAGRRRTVRQSSGRARAHTSTRAHWVDHAASTRDRSIGHTRCARDARDSASGCASGVAIIGTAIDTAAGSLYATASSRYATASSLYATASSRYAERHARDAVYATADSTSGDFIDATTDGATGIAIDATTDGPSGDFIDATTDGATGIAIDANADGTSGDIIDATTDAIHASAERRACDALDTAAHCTSRDATCRARRHHEGTYCGSGRGMERRLAQRRIASAHDKLDDADADAREAAHQSSSTARLGGAQSGRRHHHRDQGRSR
jgi:hypothetical protein